MAGRGAPVVGTKIIHDTVHGPIPLSGVLLKLLEAAQVQRLSGVRQLGLAYLVWPGANHTRLEHVVGVAYTARRLAEQVGATPGERALVEAAGLLHDVGHWPFSHTLEALIHERFGVDHQDISRALILEEGEFRWGRGRSLRAIIEEAGLAPEEVADLVATPPGPGSLSSLHDFSPDAPPKKRQRPALPPYLHQIVSGMCDADQMDYLRRDAHYTGVALGMIDIHRLIHTAAVADGALVFDRSGLHAVEGMVVARDLMYSSVYFHRTARIAETMLERAVTEFDDEELRAIAHLTDGELMAAMRKKGGVAGDISERLKFRQLYKRALQVNFDELDESDMRRLERFTEPAPRRQAEQAVERACGLPAGSVVIDVPPKALLKPGGKTSLSGLKILDGTKLRPITELSSIAKALQGRRMFDWALLVSCPKPHVERVGKAARRAVLG